MPRSIAGALRGAALGPRVARTRIARGGVWIAAAAAAVFWGRGEESGAAWQVGRGSHGCELQQVGLGEPCPCAEWPARLRLLLGGQLPLNRASEADLELLPGVGPALAAAIARERLEHGPFAELRDLDRVPGIGPRSLERLGPLLSSGEPSCPELRAPPQRPGPGSPR